MAILSDHGTERPSELEKERYNADPLVGGFVPPFMERFAVLDGHCAVCGCPCADHVERLANDATGWRGCTYALLQEVTRLRAELAKRPA